MWHGEEIELRTAETVQHASSGPNHTQLPCMAGQMQAHRSPSSAQHRLCVAGGKHTPPTRFPSLLQVPIGCQRYTVKLKKPLGIVLEQVGLRCPWQ